MDADKTATPTIVRYLDNIAYQINFTTSDAIGVWRVEASLDYEVDAVTGQVVNAGEWVPLILSGSPAAAGANDEILININQNPFNALRLVYDRTSGDGSMSAFIMARQIGG